MRRLALAFACLAVLALGLVVAPAFSLRPFVPRPVDFEVAGPAVVASGGSYTSPVVRAPQRFTLVGMRWASRAQPRIALRARKAGERWTRWTPVPADPDDAPDAGTRERSPLGFSAPVWTGDADFVQYRLSRPVAGVRLHFVNALGTATPAARVKTALRLVAHRATIAVAGIVAPARAQTPGEPPIQDRAAWGAENCPPRAEPTFGDVQAALVHHTVSANEYTQAEVPAIILSICRYHRNSNGWNDIGYNFLVDKYGGIWEGRAGGVDQAVVGAQAQGYNSQTTGIADIGNHQDVPATELELNAFAALIRWKLPLHGVPTSGSVTLTSGGGSLNRYPSGTPVTIDRIAGHRDADSTACPGEAFYAQLPDLRARVGAVGPSGLARTRIEAVLRPERIVYPAEATLSGTLRQINGDPVPGAALNVQAYGTSGWRTAWRATTADDGRFMLPVGARLSHMIRVQFLGDAERLATSSKPMTLAVVPDVSLERSASRRPVGQTVTLSGTVSPSKPSLVLVVERRSGAKKARGSLKLAARGGHFRRTYRFHSSGLFRFQVAFAGDEQNAAASSAPVYVRATEPVFGSTGGGVSAEAAGRR